LRHKIILSYHNQPLPSLIIPVPLHPKRLRERGFNQALEIAKPISKKLKIPIDKKSCYRIRHTAAQSGLSQSDRLKNLANAFEMKKPLIAKHIALIDDVMTTGQTLMELANLLYKNGVEKIDIWCCAKTFLSQKKF
jgi:ComF family protein